MSPSPKVPPSNAPSPDLAALRQPIRGLLLERLTEEIVRGELPPERPVNLARLAARFNVSVTPVREALFELAGSGLTEAPLGRGFVVPPLSAREVGEIYPLIWTLEVFALRQAPPSGEVFRELERLQTDLAGQSDPARALELDRAWHAELLAGYDNRTLHELLDRLKNRAARYEYAYMRERERVLASVGQHRRILDTLAVGDLDAAAEALEENWRVGPRYLLPWLEGSDGTPGDSESPRPDPAGTP